jgi:hypothetical protein
VKDLTKIIKQIKVKREELLFENSKKDSREFQKWCKGFEFLFIMKPQ